MPKFATLNDSYSRPKIELIDCFKQEKRSKETDTKGMTKTTERETVNNLQTNKPTTMYTEFHTQTDRHKDRSLSTTEIEG